MHRGEMGHIITVISYTCSWLVNMSTIKKVYQKQCNINNLPLTVDDACSKWFGVWSYLGTVALLCYLLLTIDSLDNDLRQVIHSRLSRFDKTPLFQSRNVIWYIVSNSATTQGNIKRFDGFTSMKDAASAFYLLTSPVGTRSSSFHKI